MKRNKVSLLLAMVFFVLVTTYSAWNDLSTDKQELDNASLVKVQLYKITELNRVVTQLQRERGLTAIYQAAPDETSLALLQEQYLVTSKVLAGASHAVDLLTLQQRRKTLQASDLVHADQKATYRTYTELVQQLLFRSEEMVFNTHNNKIKNALITYHLLKNVQENAGQLRAKVGSLLADKSNATQSRQEVIVHHSIHYLLLSKLQVHLSKKMLDLINKMQEQSCMQQTGHIVKRIMADGLKEIKISPMEWFKLSTCAVDTIHDTAGKSLALIQNDAIQNLKEAQENLIQHLIFWIGGFITLVVLFFIVQKRSRELSEQHQLLGNYQEAIDYSTIVSKTDNKGHITYVNSAFCDISGYRTDELINQPHKIVRHPEMPKEVFQEMWDTLKKGKKWNGIVKNLKKDGSTYWVDASISPIFDIEGEIVEYMAIRRDITDIILLNEEIRNTQSELIYRMGEAVESRSKESGHHVQRVAHYSKLLAQLAGLESDECEIIFSASTMHDVGKLSIPDKVLLKAGKLSDEEWKIMKTHAEVGYKILEGSERPLLKMAATVAYEHHEHYNGNGYPRGLKGDEISIYGRIVAVTDVFDALATDRIYKKAWPLKDIFEHLKAESGKQFDPKLITLVLTNLDQFLEIKNAFQDK